MKVIKSIVAVVMVGAFSVIAAPSASASSLLQVIAHRGDKAVTPEQTKASFKSAIKAGADAIEFDVRFTKDDKPVVIHDDTLDRTTNCTGKVSSITWDKLSKCDAGSWFDEKFKGERVPSLSDTLALIKPSDVKIYVHLKSSSKSDMKAIMKRVVHHKMNTKRVIMFSDSETAIKNIKSAGAKSVGYIFNDSSGWRKDYPVIIAYNTTVTKALVAKAKSQGKFVIACQSTEISYDGVKNAGLDGFMTNDLADALQEVS